MMLIGILFTLASHSVAIQDVAKVVVIEVEDRSAAIKKLRPWDVTYTLYQVAGAQKQKMQDVRSKMARVTRDEQKMIHISASTKVGGQDVIDEAWLDIETLSPRFKKVPHPDGNLEEVEVLETAVLGVIRNAAGEEIRAIDEEYETPAFDGMAPELLFRTLKLKPGQRLRFPTLKLEHGGEPSWQVLKVEGREKIEAGGKKVNALRIRVKHPDMGVETVFWLSAKVPYVLRKEITFKSGMQIHWEVTTVH